MTARNGTAAWIGCAVALAIAVAGCSTRPSITSITPSTATHDRAAVDAALRTVRIARCPAASPVLRASDVSGTGSSLEPLVPNRLLLCGYYGPFIDDRTERVTAQALVTNQAALDRFRTSLNKLGGAPSGLISCPNDTEASVLEIFTDGIHEVELVQGMTGCQRVDNGNRLGWVGTSDVGYAVMGLLPATFCTAVWFPPADCNSAGAMPGR
jgi:hypothetical protein